MRQGRRTQDAGRRTQGKENQCESFVKRKWRFLDRQLIAEE